MSTEVHKYIEKALEKNQNLFNAEIITFPNDKNLNSSENLEINTLNYWKISDKSNDDQLRAVIGICFMLGALTLMGLYSYLI